MDSRDTFPNKFEAFFLVAVLFATEFVASAAFDEMSLLDNMDWRGVSGFITVVGNGMLFVALMAYKRMNYRALFHPAASSVSATLALVSAPILLLVPGLVFMTSLLNGLVISFIPMSNEDVAVFDEVMRLGWSTIFFTCVVAPLLEEMLFRGIILRSFLQQYSRANAILWSAFLFGLAHLNAYQFFTGLLLGIVAGWLFERTRSLWPCVLLHAAFNLYVTLANNGLISMYSVRMLAVTLVCAIAGSLLLFHCLVPVETTSRRRTIDDDAHE